MRRAWVGLWTLAFLPALVGAQDPAVPARRPAGADVRPAPADVDLLGIRNIFRFADSSLDRIPPPRVERPAGPGPDEKALPTPRPGPRLVGLVEKSGSLAAAVSVEGEVILLAEGQSARGYTVLDIGDESVSLRSPTGEVESLQLP